MGCADDEFGKATSLDVVDGEWHHIVCVAQKLKMVRAGSAGGDGEVVAARGIRAQGPCHR